MQCKWQLNFHTAPPSRWQKTDEIHNFHGRCSMDAPPGDAGSSTRKKRLMTGSVTASESIQTAAHLAFWVLSCAAGRCGSPSPSLHSVQNRCELSVSQQCSCGCGWCRHEPKLMNLLKYVHKEGSQRRGVEQAVVCGSSS